MHELINKIKLYAGKHFVLWGMKLNADFFNGLVMDISQKSSIDFTKKVLHSQGIMTCEMRRCLNRAPLRRVDNLYYCVAHYQIMTKEKARQLSGA